MRIAGLQKLTLLDFPGHVSCTIFTGGCNMRCPFCHNAALVLPEQLADEPDREEEVLALLKKRRGILEGVVVSGGEPLLQADVRSFIEYVKDLGYLVKLDTNGTFPKKLKELVGAGLVDYVAMDIKNAPALYRMTAGVPTLDLAAVDLNVRARILPYPDRPRWRGRRRLRRQNAVFPYHRRTKERSRSKDRYGAASAR